MCSLLRAPSTQGESQLLNLTRVVIVTKAAFTLIFVLISIDFVVVVFVVFIVIIIIVHARVEHYVVRIMLL